MAKISFSILVFAFLTAGFAGQTASAAAQVGTVVQINAGEIVVQAADESDAGETGQAAYRITPETQYRNAEGWHDIKYGYLVEIDFDNAGPFKRALSISVELKKTFP